MAKRRGRRDYPNPIANDPLSVLIAPVQSPLSFVEDRRTYHPEGPYRPFLSVSGIVNTITTETTSDAQRIRPSRRSARLARSPKAQLVFGGPDTSQRTHNHPAEASVCAKRETRREVIFASGRGGSKHKRKVRRNETSKYGC